MGKSFRVDPYGDDGYNDRGAMKRQRKLEKQVRLRRSRRQDAIPAEAEDDEQPFDVMSTIDSSWAD